MGSNMDTCIAGQRVTLSSEGPFLLGLLLEPFKLQVRWRGSLLRHASVRICSLYWPILAAAANNAWGVLLGFEHEENWREQNMTGMYLVVTVLSSTKCFCSILLILPGIHTR